MMAARSAGSNHVDTIVAGGGTTGAVVARLLAGTTDQTVLLLEVGPDCLRLTAADPQCPPLLDHGNLTVLEVQDIEVLLDGLEIAREIIGTSAKSDRLGAEPAPGREASTRQQARAWIANNVAHYYHPVVACKWDPRATRTMSWMPGEPFMELMGCSWPAVRLCPCDPAGELQHAGRRCWRNSCICSDQPAMNLSFRNAGPVSGKSGGSRILRS